MPPTSRWRCIGVFFVLTSWAFLASSDGAIAAAGAEPRHVRVRPQRRVRRLGLDDDPRGAHRHELLRRHAGLPQRGLALHVRPGSRRLPAPLPAHSAPHAPVAGRRRRDRLRRRDARGHRVRRRRARPAHQPLGGPHRLRRGRPDAADHDHVTGGPGLLRQAGDLRLGADRRTGPVADRIRRDHRTSRCRTSPRSRARTRRSSTACPTCTCVTVVVAVAVAMRARQERPETYANMGRTLVD